MGVMETKKRFDAVAGPEKAIACSPEGTFVIFHTLSLTLYAPRVGSKSGLRDATLSMICSAVTFLFLEMRPMRLTLAFEVLVQVAAGVEDHTAEDVFQGIAV